MDGVYGTVNNICSREAFVKKVLVIVFACLMAMLCAPIAQGMDSMYLCSVEDTLKGGMWDATQMLDSSQTVFDYNVPEDGISLLVFYSNTCGNSKRVVQELAQSEWADDPKVNLVAVECSEGSWMDTYTFFQETAGEKSSAFTIWYKAEWLQWYYANTVGSYDSLEYPLVIAAKEDSKGVRLRAASTGYQMPAVYSYMIETVLDMEPPPTELNYSVIGNEVRIDGFSTNQTQLVVPETIDGLPVTRIGDYAFDYSAIQSVQLPDTIKYIGFGAFSDCNYLTQIDLPDSLEEIAYGAFGDCDKLTEITLPRSLTAIGDRVFYDCDALSSIYVAEGNTTFKVVDNVLYTADSSELIYYPSTKTDKTYAILDGTTNVREDAMAFCPVEELTLPNSLKEFTRKSLYACPKLQEFCVADDHPTLMTEDGLLYSKDMSVLYACPTALEGSLSVPEGIVRIEDKAFSNCSKLNVITLPSSLREIGYRAFGECLGLKALEIPNGLTRVETEAFYCCMNLNELVFPKSLEYLGYYCFCYCYARDLYFQGDAPEVDRNLYTSANIYHTNSSSGWNDVFWDNYNLKLWNGGDLPLLSGQGSDYWGYNYTWELDRNTGTLILSSYAFRNPSNYRTGDWVGYAEQIKHLVLEDTVQFDVNVCAFYPNLESMVLPDTLQTIPDTAFNGSRQPIAITVAEGNPYFCSQEGMLYSADKTRLLYAGGLEGLTEYTVPRSVTAIDYYAFLNTKLTDLELPRKLSTSFFGLRAPTLERVSITGSSNFKAVDGVLYNAKQTWVIFYPNGRNGSYYEIPEGTAMVERYAFAYTANLTKVSFPETMFTIMPYAFYGSSITNASFAGPIHGMAERAFSKSALEELDIVVSNYVGDLAFQECTQLKRVALNGALSTGDGLFYGCTALTDVTLSTRLTTLPYNTFGDCTALTSIMLPESITEIESGAFNGCKSMKRIYVPGAPPVMSDDFSRMNITPEMVVDQESDDWRLLVGCEWGGCTLVDWEKPKSASARWRNDKLYITLQCVLKDDPLYVAFYDGQGRMLRCQMIPMAEGALNSITVPKNTADIRIFFMGQDYAPTMPVMLPD